MTTKIASIRVENVSDIQQHTYTRECVGCIILTQDKKILLQHRPKTWQIFPGCVATFGGELEGDEDPIEALQRELHEALGAKVDIKNVVHLGAITEAVTEFKELIHVFFWHDEQGNITGCYEGKPLYFDNCEAVQAHNKIMDDVQWLLQICQEQGLLV
jgi:8-oxo-dGTP diphosphatase